MDGEIEPGDLASALADGEAATDVAAGDPVVVDIRPAAAFRRGHIPGSLNLPLGELTGGVEALDGAEHVVTVCPHGEASVQAARLVAAYEGFDGTVESLAGGLAAWDGPLEEGPAETVDGAAAGAGGSDAPTEPDAPF